MSEHEDTRIGELYGLIDMTKSMQNPPDIKDKVFRIWYAIEMLESRIDGLLEKENTNV